MITRWNRQFGRRVYLGGSYAWAELCVGEHSLFVWRYKGVFRMSRLFEYRNWSAT